MGKTPASEVRLFLKQKGWLQLSYYGQFFWIHEHLTGKDSNGAARIVCMREAVKMTRKAGI